MKVRRILFRESGSYNDMAIRPYIADFDQRKVDHLSSATDGGRLLLPKNLSGLAVGMLRPSSENQGVAPIANGWDTRRFMFMMECELHASGRQVNSMVISGYTDQVGAGNLMGSKVSLDPDMRMYFNSKFHVRQLLEYGARGNQWGGKVHDSYQIVTRSQRGDLRRGGQVSTMTMRPEDIISRGSVSADFRDLAGSDNYLDTRGSLQRDGLRLSKRSNTQSSSYLSRTLGALRDATDDDGIEDNPAARLNQARSQVKEFSISNDPIFEEMQKDTSIMEDGYITWGELCDMNHDIDKIADVWFSDRNTPSHARGDSEKWTGSDNETIGATIISNTIPAFLAEAMYTEIDFTITNDTIGSQLLTRVTKLTPYLPETDIDANYNHLISRIEFELFPEIQFGEQMALSVRVQSSLYGETRVTIQYDNYPEAVFVYPTFCDSVSSPIITNDMSFMNNLSNNILELDRLLQESSSTEDSHQSRSNLKRHI
jgi:hypothetical protein